MFETVILPIFSLLRRTPPPHPEELAVVVVAMSCVEKLFTFFCFQPRNLTNICCVSSNSCASRKANNLHTL
jgi:hypothetical protein